VYDGFVATDVIIAGGGIIGCSIAWRLAQRGLKVSVLDSGRIGHEASRAGAGMLAPGGEAGPESPWARHMVASLEMYPVFVEELEAASGLPIEFQLCGAHEYGCDEADWNRIVARAEKQRTLGIESIVEEGRLFYPKDGQVKPSHVIRAIVEAAGRLGVEFLEGTAVKSIESNGVITENGLMPAGTIVLAAGAWASQLGEELPRTFPVKGHLIGYRMPKGSVPYIQRRGHHYVLQRKCGFTIAGSTSESVGFDRTIDLDQVAKLHEETKRFIPGLPDDWESAWIGFRPATDGEPRVERWRDSNLWLAYGHFRNGILLAPLTAKLIADGITA
jgi:glycine oxidase